MRRWLGRLVRDQRGTASAEAALMFPVMALCWAALMLAYERLDRYLDAVEQARNEAWRFSAAGCEASEDVAAPSSNRVHCISDGDASWTRLSSKIPFAGFMVRSISGFELENTAQREHTRPALLGGGSRPVAYTYHTMCNEKPRELNYVLRASFCEQIRNLGLNLNFAVDCPSPPPRGDDACH